MQLLLGCFLAALLPQKCRGSERARSSKCSGRRRRRCYAEYRNQYAEAFAAARSGRLPRAQLAHPMPWRRVRFPLRGEIPALAAKLYLRATLQRTSPGGVSANPGKAHGVVRGWRKLLDLSCFQGAADRRKNGGRSVFAGGLASTVLQNVSKDIAIGVAPAKAASTVRTQRESCWRSRPKRRSSSSSRANASSAATDSSSARGRGACFLRWPANSTPRRCPCNTREPKARGAFR